MKSKITYWWNVSTEYQYGWMEIFFCILAAYYRYGMGQSVKRFFYSLVLGWPRRPKLEPTKSETPDFYRMIERAPNFGDMLKVDILAKYDPN